MKKLMTILFISLFVCTRMSAQTAHPFISTMETQLKTLDTASTGATLMTLANTFERIGKTEKNRWEPYYYAAFCYAMMTAGSPDKSRIDVLADKAEGYLNDATVIDANNSEVNALRAWVLYMRVSVDPMARWQTIGREAAGYLERSKAQDPSNPRPYYIEGRTKLRVPEGLGGGAEAALASVNTSLEKFAAFKPASTIAPNWGKQPAERFQRDLNAKISNK